VSSNSSGHLLDNLFGVVHTKVTGDTTEAIILAEFLKAGFPVLIPFGENHRYDLVIEAGGRFLRVQCKTASPCGRNGDNACVRFHAYSPRHGPQAALSARARLAGYSTPAQRFDLEAAPDRYPDSVTYELRDILTSQQAMAACNNGIPGAGRH